MYGCMMVSFREKLTVKVVLYHMYSIIKKNKQLIKRACCPGPAALVDGPTRLSSSSICPDPGSEFAEGCSHGDEQRLTRRDFDMTGRKQEGPSITSMPDEAVRRSPPAIICKNVKLEDDAFRSTLKVRFRRGTTCASTGTTISETWTPWMPSPGRLESGGKIYEIPYAMVVLSRLDEEAAAPPP
ncbi:hypothetical protein BDZ89DRAFT_1051632 [Hymenopellis radicata]|nr:hypothetical protein BDZ89DRAFT_1051632 [Hymenopellis radicata]